MDFQYTNEQSENSYPQGLPLTPCPSPSTSSPVGVSCESGRISESVSSTTEQSRQSSQIAANDGRHCQSIRGAGDVILDSICTFCMKRQPCEKVKQATQTTISHLPPEEDLILAATLDSGVISASTTGPKSSESYTGSALYSEKAYPLIPSPCPDGGLRAWLTVLGSFFTTIATFGFINSVGILQAHLETHQLSNFSSSDIAWIPGFNIFLCLFLGVQIGPLFDRYGPRWLMPAGGAGYVGGLVIMSFLGCDSCGDQHRGGGGKRYVSLLLTWGVLCGTGAALLCTTALSVISHWFDKRRGLASGIVFVGSSIGGVGFPLLMRTTLPTLGWAWTIRIIAGIVALLVGMGSFLIRGRIRGGKGDGLIDLRCFRDWRLVWTTLGISCTCLNRIDHSSCADSSCSDRVCTHRSHGPASDLGDPGGLWPSGLIQHCGTDQWVSFMNAHRVVS